MTKKILYALILVVFLGLTDGCHHKQAQKSLRTVTVKAQSSETVLHYAGTINPLTKTPIIAAEDGVVSKMAFQYGDRLPKGQLLYIIRSSKQQEDFQTALTNYVKAKQTLATSRAKNSNTYQLFQEGIVSRDDMQTAREQYYTDKLAFFQAKTKFDDLLKLHQITRFPDLSLADVDQINKLLDSYRQQIENISIYTPQSGIALLPKDDPKSGVLLGVNVKAGDVLLFVGNVTGISIAINVNEVDINQLKEGQKVMVSSDVLPNMVLNGYISHINTQALSSGGGSPVFALKIIVPKITAQERRLIHIGMSAAVSITILHKPQILIPINAVTRQNGNTTVRVLDKTTGKIKIVTVTTGATTKSDVVITSGLQSGDQVVISD